MDVEFIKYQYESRKDGDREATSKRFKLGVRHLQMLYMFVTSICVGILRGCVGVSMVAVNDEDRRNDTYIKVHNWDRSIQGTFLFAFFFGYAVMFIPAELWLKKVGGKYIHTAIMLINGALCSAMPTIINKGTYFAIFSAFLFMGMSQTALAPANEALLEKWLPPDEKEYFNWLIYGGVLLGLIIGPPVAGVISESALGWELIFYSLAMMALSMAAICFALTANSPGQHQAVGDSEKEYLESVIIARKRDSSSVPWREILRSPQFWGIASAHVFSNSAFVFYLTDVPLYLKKQNLTLRESTAWLPLPLFTMWIVYLIMKPIAQLVVALCEPNPYTTIIVPRRRINIRKIINFICELGFLLVLLILPVFTQRFLPTVLLFTAFGGLLGLQFLGFLENIADNSKNYTSDMLMMSSAVANSVGAFIPVATGLILRDDESNFHRWRNLLLFMAMLCFICNKLYLTFSKSYRQDFDRKTDRFARKSPNNAVYCPIEMQLVLDK